MTYVEYALMEGDHIVNVVTTQEPQADIIQRWPDYEVKPLDSLPMAVKQRYEFWDQRP